MGVVVHHFDISEWDWVLVEVVAAMQAALLDVDLLPIFLA